MNRQRNLYGEPVDLTTGQGRKLMKVSAHTHDVISRAKGSKPMNMIEITELGMKLAVLVLNKLPPSDIVKILSTNDLKDIEQTLSTLFIKN